MYAKIKKSSFESAIPIGIKKQKFYKSCTFKREQKLSNISFESFLLQTI
jgi:hypothetical protein